MLRAFVNIGPWLRPIPAIVGFVTLVLQPRPIYEIGLPKPLLTLCRRCAVACEKRALCNPQRTGCCSFGCPMDQWKNNLPSFTDDAGRAGARARSPSPEAGPVNTPSRSLSPQRRAGAGPRDEHGAAPAQFPGTCDSAELWLGCEVGGKGVGASVCQSVRRVTGRVA